MSKHRNIVTSVGLSALVLAAAASHSRADLLASSSSVWKSSTTYSGGTVSQTNANNFTVGNIAVSPQSSAFARFTAQTLVPGQTITLSGTVSLVSTANVGNDQFRFGLLNDNGSSGETGWLGYAVENAVAAPSTGNIIGRTTGNSGLGVSGTGSYGVAGGQSTAGAGAPMTTGTYNLLLSLTEVSTTNMTITASIVQTVGGTYAWTNTFSDSPGGNGGNISTNTFDAVEFFTGAGQVDTASTETFSNVQIGVSNLPEPTVLGLPVMMATGLLGRRRR